MDYILFIIWLIFMILAHYLFKNEINYLKRKLTLLFKYSPYFKDSIKKMIKTFLYTSFTLIVGNTFEHLDLWKIYVGVEQDSIVGSLFIRCNSVEYEIFGLSLNQAYQNQGLELDLLSVSLEDCLNPSLDYVLFFVDEETPTQIEATLRVGFNPIDTYRCYKIQL